MSDEFIRNMRGYGLSPRAAHDLSNVVAGVANQRDGHTKIEAALRDAGISERSARRESHKLHGSMRRLRTNIPG